MSDLITIQKTSLRMTPKAVAALIIGIAGCEAGWAYGIPGIIVGAIALSMAKQAQILLAAHPELYRGHKIIDAALRWSRVAIIQGIILTVLYILYFFIIVSLLSSGDGSYPYDSYSPFM